MTVNDRIKEITTVRKWIREFSLFGDKTRTDFAESSGYRYAFAKSDQLLFRYLTKTRDENNCQHVFLSVDARDVSHNPLFVFYRIHAFTNNDIRLHFTILNSLADGQFKTKERIIQDVFNTNVYDIEDGIDSTLYKKLEEYLKLGILASKKEGKLKLYGLNRSCIDLERWAFAIHFFSEIDPLGVVGSYLNDRLKRTTKYHSCDPFLFRHHYIHHALDAEIVQTIADAIHKQSSVIVLNHPRLQKSGCANQKSELVPIRFYHSVQSGRRYLVALRCTNHQMSFFRLDRIQSVKLGNTVPDYPHCYNNALERLKNVWGVSDIGNSELTHLEMIIKVQSPDDYALKRLDAEKRHGSVEYIDACTARFSIDVWEDREMLPWVRTFIGNIISLKCSNQSFVDQFKHDLRESLKLYTKGEL